MFLTSQACFRKTGYEIKSVAIDQADIKTIVLKDGSANWDIVKDTTESPAGEESASEMKILLKKIELLNSSVSYVDHESNIEAYLDKVNSQMKW